MSFIKTHFLHVSKYSKRASMATKSYVCILQSHMHIFYRKSDFARLPVAGKSRHSHRHQQCPVLCLTIQYLCNWKHEAGHAYYR